MHYMLYSTFREILVLIKGKEGKRERIEPLEKATGPLIDSTKINTRRFGNTPMMTIICNLIL